MECDGVGLLRRAARIARREDAEPSERIKEVLRLLVESLDLEDASLLLPDVRRRIFFESVDAAGPASFKTCSIPFGRGPESKALQGREPAGTARRLCFPVSSPSRSPALLVLKQKPGKKISSARFPLVEALGEQVADILDRRLRDAELRARVERQRLLRRLGESLSRARSMRELLAQTTGALLGVSGAIGAVVHPLSAEFPGSRRYARVRPGCGKWRRAFLDLEERYAPRTLGENHLFCREDILSSAVGSPALDLIVVPMVFQERTFGTLTLIFAAASVDLDEETLGFHTSLGWLVAHAIDRIVARERLAALSAENDRKLRETTLLYGVSRAMHSTLRLNELVHLILSAAVMPEGGGFERAMLFTINERSDTLQGMLGVTRKSASLVLPPQRNADGWEPPLVSEEAQATQRRGHFCRRVMKQRLPFEAADNALARAAHRRRVVYVAHPEDEPPTGAALSGELDLAPYACAPLLGRDRLLGVLVVDNPASQEAISPERLRFLELFANQAAVAMENSMLVRRLESARADLQETQERLIHGEKMAVLGEMSASVAHELRNPLVSIGGFAQRLARIAEAGTREQEYGAIIAREVKRMEEMLTNILAFSKKQMFCFSGCRIAAMIEEALQLEEDALRRQNIELKKEIVHNLPAIQGDEKKLQQVLINLIANARQAMPNGGLLSIRACRTTLRGDRAVAVKVEDTGGGISNEVMRNIFNPFFSTKEEGTGLGLSISHRIVEHHRGEIEVQNREKGALFILRLPVDGSPNLSIDKNRRFG